MPDLATPTVASAAMTTAVGPSSTPGASPGSPGAVGVGIGAAHRAVGEGPRPAPPGPAVLEVAALAYTPGPPPRSVTSVTVRGDLDLRGFSGTKGRPGGYEIGEARSVEAHVRGEADGTARLHDRVDGVGTPLRTRRRDRRSPRCSWPAVLPKCSNVNVNVTVSDTTAAAFATPTVASGATTAVVTPSSTPGGVAGIAGAVGVGIDAAHRRVGEGSADATGTRARRRHAVDVHARAPRPDPSRSSRWRPPGWWPSPPGARVEPARDQIRAAAASREPPRSR